MERRSHKGSIELRELPGSAPVIAGYAAVFDSPSFDMGFIETIDPAAFNRTVNAADVRGLGNHDVNWLLGRAKSGTLRLFVDERGLGYEVTVNPADPDGVRALEKVRRGDWDGSSFSFQTIRDQWTWDATPPQRRLLEVALIDVGPVTFPAYPDATANARDLRGALEPIAKTCGRPVDQLVAAMQTGEIRSIMVTPEQRQAGTLVWGPEDGFKDLLDDVDEQVNIAGAYQYTAVDVTLDLARVLIYAIDGDYYVASLSVDDAGNPTVAPAEQWAPVDQGWVEVAPELGDRALARLVEQRAGKKISAATREILEGAIAALTALLDTGIENDAAVEDETERSFRELLLIRERELEMLQL